MTNEMLQNLVPLLLRPLRLVLSAETLRTTRIFLLKATHFPFVALILGWELWQQYWNRRSQPESPLALAPQGLKGSASYRLPAGVQPLLSTGTLQTPVNAQRRTGRLPVVLKSPHDAVATTSSTVTTVEALESAVDALRTQLDKITSLLEEEKRARTEQGSQT